MGGKRMPTTPLGLSNRFTPAVATKCDLTDISLTLKPYSPNPDPNPNPNPDPYPDPYTLALTRCDLTDLSLMSPSREVEKSLTDAKVY